MVNKGLFPRHEGHLDELSQLEALIQQAGPLLESRVISYSATRDHLYPVYSLRLGNPSPEVPALAFVGGIHGVERIGTQVILAFLESLITRLRWDETLLETLNHVKLVFLPLMNPVGMFRNWRANGNGVDLMRNSPVDADEKVPWLGGGHRLSRHLPWYRGRLGADMESEALALGKVIREELFPAPFSLVLDCHSGFGTRDRIWFPYAYSRTQVVEHLPELYQLRKMLFTTYPHLHYLFEPQSRHYTTHGDLWDHLYLQAIEQQRTFLPLTLEMGSWLWVKKNPAQLRRLVGMFHPIQPHRVRRVLRHHQLLMEFLVRATRSYDRWSSAMIRERNRDEARALWYSDVFCSAR